jgi:hypothetical protein
VRIRKRFETVVQTVFFLNIKNHLNKGNRSSN